MNGMTRCVYCHDDCIAEVKCDCGAIYHEACAVELRKCATLGCSAVLAVTAESVYVEPAVSKSLNPVRFLFSLLYQAWILVSEMPLAPPPGPATVDRRLLTDKILNARTPKDIADLL